MKILLDSHIWLWHLAGSDRLPKVLAEAIEKEENEVWLSPISVWEAIVLAERGRIELAPDPISWVREALRTGGFREAPLTTEVAVKSREIKLPHQDPADRFLAATALIFGLKLATVDKVFLQTNWLPTV